MHYIYFRSTKMQTLNITMFKLHQTFSCFFSGYKRNHKNRVLIWSKRFEISLKLKARALSNFCDSPTGFEITTIQLLVVLRLMIFSSTSSYSTTIIWNPHHRWDCVMGSCSPETDILCGPAKNKNISVKILQTRKLMSFSQQWDTYACDINTYCIPLRYYVLIVLNAGYTSNWTI